MTGERGGAGRRMRFARSLALSFAGPFALATVLWAALFAAPLATAADDATATLHLFAPREQVTLNPLLWTTLDGLQIALLAYDPLLFADARNHLQPDLAAVVPTLANGGIARDGKTITFRLRHGVRWHDGAPFTSADVAFTFERIIDPKVNIATRAGYDRIARIATPDAYTVVVSLKEPFAPFVTVAGAEYPIVPEHVLAHSADINTDPIGVSPIGTGPYKFLSWEHGSRIEYVANDAYFLGAPKIKRLAVAEIADQDTAALELRTHQLDLGNIADPSAFALLRMQSDLRTSTEPALNFVAFALNTTSPILRDVRVRRALSMAIDRASLVAKTTYGTGIIAYAELPPALWTRHPPHNPFGYDPRGAAALLDAAGWKRGASGMRERNGVPLRLSSISLSGSKSVASIDVQVAQMLRDAGIDWSVKYYSPALFYASRSAGGPVARGDFDTASVSFGGGVDDESGYVYLCANRPPNGFNFANYCSPEMERLQRDVLRENDPVRHIADIAAIERLAVNDMPYVYLYYEPYRIVWSPRLHRTHSTSRTPWFDIQHWSFGTP